MQEERIFIALGSNLGDKYKNIENSLNMLKNYDIKLIQVSPLILTEPYGYLDQDVFLNGVAEIQFSGSPQELLRALQKIELSLKRQRLIHWGPRTIDLDILLWGQRIIDEENLIIPHPDMHNRFFVLQPLVEIAPDIIHPSFNINMKDLLIRLKQRKQ